MIYSSSKSKIIQFALSWDQVAFLMYFLSHSFFFAFTVGLHVVEPALV